MREPVGQQAVLVPVDATTPPAPAPSALSRPSSGIGVSGGANLGADGQALPVEPPGRSLATLGAGPLALFEAVRAVQVTGQDLRGIELVAIEQAEALQTRFNITARNDSAAMADLQRTLRSTAFSGQLDRLRADIQEELQLDKSVTISVAGVSFGLSLVYVLWLIRGGVLMGSYLSALPAWRVLDPLPVLSRVDEEAEEDDEALDALAEPSGNPLRNFG